MSEEQLYRTIGNIESKLESICDKLDSHMETSVKKDENHENRLQAVELIIGKITIKMAMASFAIVAVLYKAIDYVWDVLTLKS
jgi:hypothetical protein